MIMTNHSGVKRMYPSKRVWETNRSAILLFKLATTSLQEDFQEDFPGPERLVRAAVLP